VELADVIKVNGVDRFITLDRELVRIDESQRWIVKVSGQPPIRVVSDPRFADDDFDNLVDGEEFGIGTAPDNSDTDGDGRDDRLERDDSNFNPLLAEKEELLDQLRVTVVFVGLEIGDDGDSGGNAGDFGFDFGVRLPDNEGVAGLSNAFTSVVRQSYQLTGTYRATDTFQSDVKPLLPQCPDGDDEDTDPDSASFDVTLCQNIYFGIPMSGGQELRFTGLLSDSARSHSFTMTTDQSFSVEGVVAERDNSPDTKHVFFGGLEGVRYSFSETIGDRVEMSTRRAVFRGDELLTGEQIIDLSFSFDAGDNIDSGNPGGDISGIVTAYIVVQPL
jgi:hypothetical protein